MKMTVADADLAAHEEPRVSACMFHRCLQHIAVPALNAQESTGAECGACVAQELYFVEREQLMPVLDAFGARLISGAIHKRHIQMCIDRLNFIEAGAGDRMLQQLGEDFRAFTMRRHAIDARHATPAQQRDLVAAINRPRLVQPLGTDAAPATPEKDDSDE